MDDTLREFAGRLFAQSRAYDAEQTERTARYRNLEPESAELLALLARAARPRSMLELGTSNGYSTLFLADVARDTGAELVSVDVDERRTAEADAHLQSAGVRAAVVLWTADAGAVLAASPDHRWDLVFLDAERPAYAGYWADLRRTLAPGGLLVVDNVVSHADQVRTFLSLVRADVTVHSTVFPVGAGLLVVVREDDPPVSRRTPSACPPPSPARGSTPPG